jgi:dephospho-CoA kinase
VVVIDADLLGHQALQSHSVKQDLRRRFGDSIFDDRGDVLRKELAHRVFGDEPEKLAGKHDLERIVHPVIQQQTRQQIAAANEAGFDAVLLDAAVLMEAGWQDQCDAVVYVDAPEEVRQRRVAKRNGWSVEEFRRREASQLRLAEKQRRSDVVISNGSDDSRGGQELLDFLYRRWGICCKPLSNSSQQS